MYHIPKDCIFNGLSAGTFRFFLTCLLTEISYTKSCSLFSTSEIRSCLTARRGLMHFAQSKAGGTLVGRARLVDCQELDQATFLQNIARHHVPRWSMVPYKRVFAWVLQDAQRYAQPLHHEHEKGAVIWVKTWGKDQTRKRKGEDKKTAKPEVLIESPAPQIGQC